MWPYLWCQSSRCLCLFGIPCLRAAASPLVQDLDAGASLCCTLRIVALRTLWICVR